MSRPLEAALRVVPAPDPQDPEGMAVAKIRGLLAGYDRQWAGTSLRILAVERILTAPLLHRKTGKLSRTYRLGGKIDVQALDPKTKSFVVVDHKTSSEDISDITAAYWKQQAINRQWLMYIQLEKWNGCPVSCVVQDVVRKPGISIRNVTEKEYVMILRNGTYHGRQLSERACEQARKNRREDYEMYEARLAHECIIEKPGWYFKQRPLFYDRGQLEDFQDELWQDALDVRDDRLRQVHTRNDQACLQWGTPCQFLGVCSGYDTTESDNWKRRKFVHEELVALAGEGGDGRDILTHSRLSMYKLCRRKHHNLFNLAIERAEPSDALRFGTLWHEVLSEYFLALQAEQQEAAHVESAQSPTTPDAYAGAADDRPGAEAHHPGAD